MDQQTEQDIDPTFSSEWSNIHTILNHYGKELENWNSLHPVPMKTEEVTVFVFVFEIFHSFFYYP